MVNINNKKNNIKTLISQKRNTSSDGQIFGHIPEQN
jgi:hypothetical protein